MHFEEAVQEVFRAEGGLLIDAGEGGGGANFGITLTTLRVYRNDPNLTLDDLAYMSMDEAKAIYKSLFWDALELGRVTGRLSAILLMDQAVNKGTWGLKVQLRNTLIKRCKAVLPEKPEMAEMINIVNGVPDREFFRRFVCDAQHAYLDLCEKNPEKQRWLRVWLVRTHNLLKLLV